MNMRKIHLLGVALLAVFMFDAVVATTAMAELATVAAGNEKAFWLVNGVAIANGEASALASETLGTIFLANLSLGVTIECQKGILDGKVYNLGMTEGENGFGLIEKFLEVTATGTREITGLTVNGLPCRTTVNIPACENREGHPEVWAQSLPWLVTINLMTLDSEENPASLFLALLSTDGAGQPAYEVRCLTFGGLTTVDELCEGETSGDLELMENTPNPMTLLVNASPEEQELEQLEVTCGTTAQSGAQEGSGEIKLVNGGELDVSSTR